MPSMDPAINTNPIPHTPLPCEESCRGCGSDDIGLRFFAKGQKLTAKYEDLNAGIFATPFVFAEEGEFPTFPTFTVTNDCLLRRCKTCGREWSSLVVEEEQP